jgi:shikimate 5-dehydrogenase
MKSVSFTLGLLGSRIQKSKSPLMHGQWIQEFELNGRYELFHAENEELAKQLLATLLSDSCFLGCNITLPFKETVLQWLPDLTRGKQLFIEKSEAVKLVGAANTLLRCPHQGIGHWLLENTDPIGVKCTLNQLLKVSSNSLKTKRVQQSNDRWCCVVLGNGGAARSVSIGLPEQIQWDRLIYLCRRKKIMPDFGPCVRSETYLFEEQNALLETFKSVSLLVVNTLPTPQESKERSSVQPDNDPTLVFLKALSEISKTQEMKQICYFDMNYAATPSYEHCIDIEIESALGTLMLQEQGRRSFELWTGHKPTSNPLIATVV